MSKNRSILLLVIFLLIINNICPAQESFKSKLSLLAAVPRDFPPQYSVDERGNPAGFAIDAMDHIASLAGIKVDYIVTDTWSEADGLLRVGQVDLIPNLGITDSRKDHFAFSSPLEVFPVMIFVRKEDTKIKGIQDLSGHRVAAVQYNVGVSLLNNRSDVELMTFDTLTEALFELLAGGADALVYPKPVLMSVARKIAVENRIKAVGEPLLLVRRAIAVRRDNEELLRILNNAVKTFMGSAQYQNIYTKWYGKSKPFWNTSKVAGLMGLSLVSVLIAMGVWRYHGLSRLNRQLNMTIEERERAELALRKSEEQFRAVFESATDCIVILDNEHNFLYANPRACQLLNMRAAQVIGKNMREIFRSRPDIMRTWMSSTDQVFSTKKSSRFEQTLNFGGKHYDVRCALSPMQGSCGNVFAVGLTFTDITEIKNAEQQLKQQLHWTIVLNRMSHSIAQRNTLESILNIVMQHLEDSFSFSLCTIGIYSNDKSHLILTNLNLKDPSLASRLGMKVGVEIPFDQTGLVDNLRINHANILSLKQLDVTSLPVGHSLLIKNLEQVGLNTGAFIPLSTGNVRFGIIAMFFKDSISFNEYEINFLNGLAEQVSLAAQNRKIYEELEKSYDELKRTQKYLMEHERLNAMGQMASGITHDINNTLAPIALYTEALLESEQGLSERAKRFLRTIQDATRDIENTTMRMRKFYSKTEDETDLKPIDIGDIMSQVIELSRPRWEDMSHKKGIFVEVRTELEEELPLLVGAGSEVREALINLVFNSVDAMPEGGMITLRAGRKVPYIVIEVSDTGKGMDEGQRQKCLEPFYTTKGDEGTGLGLATVYGVMQRHGGEIEIESEPGRGTTIRLLFPIKESETRGADRAGEPVSLAPLHILCIDDDTAVRESLMEMLQIDGHTVMIASGGEDGLKLFVSEKESGRAFDVVITDLGMPHMDGQEVAREIKQKSPDTPVILLSGWGNFNNADTEVPEYVDCVLGKPLEMHELRSAIKRLMLKDS